MNAKERNLLIVKYAFLLLVGAYILSSIWVIWRVKVLVDYAEETMPDDWATGMKGEGHYAKYWFIACIVVTILGGLLSGGAFYGVYQESSQIVMVYSALMFVIAVYGAWDKYMKVTVTAFLLPLLTGIVGILYASLNHMLIFEGSTLPDVSIKYMSKTKGGGVQQLHQQPPTPTYEDSP
ncbi:hypothetical protein TYRP_020504 [Tyrophagus putrescentiae]|nr:hypothetical protein TYRP_020504 [Tyrophagus putrescentiae]